MGKRVPFDATERQLFKIAITLEKELEDKDAKIQHLVDLIEKYKRVLHMFKHFCPDEYDAIGTIIVEEEENNRLLTIKKSFMP